MIFSNNVTALQLAGFAMVAGGTYVYGQKGKEIKAEIPADGMWLKEATDSDSVNNGSKNARNNELTPNMSEESTLVGKSNESPLSDIEMGKPIGA